MSFWVPFGLAALFMFRFIHLEMSSSVSTGEPTAAINQAVVGEDTAHARAE